MVWRGENTYSRVVGWLKILLPLTALALLSTVFLLSRSADTVGEFSIPDQVIESRARQQQITLPNYAGTTQDGDLLSIRAEAALPGGAGSPDGRITGIRAQIDLANGQGRVEITASTARLFDTDQTVQFDGGVRLVTSDGYDLRTESLRSALDKVDAGTEGTVTGSGPAGEFTAGRMTLRDVNGDGAVEMLFTDGVRLLYRP